MTPVCLMGVLRDPKAPKPCAVMAQLGTAVGVTERGEGQRMLCHLGNRDPQEVTAQPGSLWYTEQQGQMEQAPSSWHGAGIP